MYSTELYKAIATRSLNSLQQLINDPCCDLNMFLDSDSGSTVVEGLKATALHALFMPQIYNVKADDKSGWKKDSIKMIQMLLSSGRCNVNAVDRDGRTALHYAAVHQFSQGAQLLIEQPSCDLNIADGLRGYTALHLAALCAHSANDEPSVFNLLLDRSADRCDINAQVLQTSETILHLTDSLPMLRSILTNPQFTNYNCRDLKGFTALRRKLLIHLAPDVEESDFVAELIQSRRCDLSEIDPQTKNSLVHEAAHRGRNKALAALLASGDASLPTIINAKNCCESAPIHLLLGTEALKLLISNPLCDCNLPGPMGLTTFQRVVQNNSAELSAILLGCDRCNVHVRDAAGNTPLHVAASHRHLITRSDCNETLTLKVLLDSGKFDVDATNDEGLTPLMLLYLLDPARTYPEKEKLLLSYGASVGKMDKCHTTIYYTSQRHENFGLEYSSEKEEPHTLFATGDANRQTPSVMIGHVLAYSHREPAPSCPKVAAPKVTKKNNKSCTIM